MASQSSYSVGPSDIAKLLDLLNSSDVYDENAEVPAPGADAPDVDSDPVTIPETLDPVDLSDDSQEFGENRFAAHVVSVMSKLKRTT